MDEKKIKEPIILQMDGVTTMQANVRVSIVTVCYNEVSTIGRTIQSVLGQSYSDVEYIVIDGGSTDGTAEVISTFADSIAFFCSEPDCGIYDAMNKGTNVATGELIAFLNSGDWYPEDAVNTVVNAYIHSGADVIYGNMMYVDRSGKATLHKPSNPSNDFYTYMQLFHPSTFCKMILQKKYTMDTHYQIASDYKFLLQLYHENKRFFYVDKILSWFYAGGVSNQKKYINAKETKSVSMEFIGKNHELMNQYADEVIKKYENAIFILLMRRAVKYGFLGKWWTKNFDRKKSICLFGTGYISQCVSLSLLKAGIRVEAFFDNDISKQNKYLFGIRIFSPVTILQKSRCSIIIATRKFEQEIHDQLNRMNIPKENEIDIYGYHDLEKKIGIDYIRNIYTYATKRKFLCNL